MKHIAVTFKNVRGVPKWHILMDARAVLNGGVMRLQTGEKIEVDRWDLIIAHPPCTYLTVTGNSWFNIEKYGEKARQRYKDRYKAIVFFMHFILADCDRIAVENPVGIMNTAYRKPDCIIHPYYFGDDAKKKTCLWLKGLEPLKPTNVIEPTTVITGNSTDSPWHAYSWGLPPDERSKARSKTFPGIAEAMADQWGKEGGIRECI